MLNRIIIRLKLCYLKITLKSWEKYGNVYIYDIETSIMELKEEIQKLEKTIERG